MSKTRVGVVLVLLVSLVIGVVAGLTFLSLFRSQISPAMLSDFSKTTSPITFVGSGVIFGVIIAAVYSKVKVRSRCASAGNVGGAGASSTLLRSSSRPFSGGAASARCPAERASTAAES